MITETDLRQTLTELADLAPDRCHPVLLERTRERSGRRRRMSLVAGLLAAAAVVALAVGLAVNRDSRTPAGGGPLTTEVRNALTYAVISDLSPNGYPDITAEQVHASSYAVRTTVQQLSLTTQPRKLSILAGVAQLDGAPLSAPVWVVETFGFVVNGATVNVSLVDGRTLEPLVGDGYVDTKANALRLLGQFGRVVPLR